MSSKPKKPRKKRVLSRSTKDPAVTERARQKKERAEKKKLIRELGKKPFEYIDEPAMPRVRHIAASEFFHIEPVNEIHRLIQMTPHAEEYGHKMFGAGGFALPNRVVNPEKFTVEEVIQLSGFCGVNPAWMFLQIIAEYNEVLAHQQKDLAAAAARSKKAYWLRQQAKRLKASHKLAIDVLKTFSLVSEQGKWLRDIPNAGSQDEQ